MQLTASYLAVETEKNCPDGLCAVLDQFGTLNGFVDVCQSLKIRITVY